MCVAVPGRVASISPPTPGAVMGRVDFGDRSLDINLVMLPDVGIGDYVLVHSGYAIRTVSADSATNSPFDPPPELSGKA